jgi:hypothetical protein
VEENVGPLGKADRTVRKTRNRLRPAEKWVDPCSIRPEPRVRKPGQYEFVLLDRARYPTPTSLPSSAIDELFTISLTADNADASYGYGMATINAPIPPTPVVGASRINIAMPPVTRYPLPTTAK